MFQVDIAPTVVDLRDPYADSTSQRTKMHLRCDRELLSTKLRHRIPHVKRNAVDLFTFDLRLALGYRPMNPNLKLEPI
jgi:hypothetical protein